MNTRFLLLLAFVLSLSRLPARESEVPATEAALIALDAQFNEAFAWWARVYDAESGGCFYSLSAKHAAATDPRFGPDIESTQKLLGVMQWTGLLDQAPPAFKAGVIRFLQARQDPESGLFHDPQHRDQYSHLTLTRATSMAMDSLELVGGEPLYPSPLERTAASEEAATVFAYLESPAAMEAWLRELPWDKNTWTVGARLRAQWPFIRRLPAEQRAALLRPIEKRVRENQKEDGFLGDAVAETWGYRLSGTYKVLAFLQLAGAELPRAANVEETLLHILFEKEYDNSIIVYNTANLLNILHRNGEGFNKAERIRLVRRCTELLHTMRAPDGAFFTHTYRPTPVEMGKQLGLDVVESNSNATGLAHMTRNILIEFLTGRPSPHPHPRGPALIAGLAAAPAP